MNNELDEANKIKAKFFAILSHDLRSPLANLIDFLRLQKEEPGLLTAENASVHQQKITASAEALLENMETMLLWSKEQMKIFKPKVKTIDVNKLFDYLRKFFSSAEHVTFIFTNPQNLTITTDENYLQTIMYNLTGNAVKVLQHRTNALIEWKAVKVNSKVILSISDNGTGFSTEQLNNYYNNSDGTNSKTGFGFHIIKDLAKAIEWDIALQTDQEKGTTFNLTAK